MIDFELEVHAADCSWERMPWEGSFCGCFQRLRRPLPFQVSVVAHSYGTFVTSVLAQHHPERLHFACLIDPVGWMGVSYKLLFCW